MPPAVALRIWPMMILSASANGANGPVRGLMYPIRIVSLSAANARVPENAAPVGDRSRGLEKMALADRCEIRGSLLWVFLSRNIRPPRENAMAGGSVAPSRDAPLGSSGMDYWMTRKRFATPGSPDAREIARLREILSLIPDS